MTTDPSQKPSRGLLARLFGPLNSVSFGITLLVILFIYCTIGSAGAFYPTSANIFSADNWAYSQIRTFRVFEMTEYEWFNWWPFDLLIGLICLNITVVTLRRIRFNAINAGVWMIHTGIIILCAGSVWYFGTKVEGDAPVVRRQVSIELPNGERGEMPVIPGAATRIGRGLGAWEFEVSSANPNYTMLSGPDEGEKFFSVMVSVKPPASEPFMRQLIVGHPENTEDVVRSDDPAQPMARAIKVLGKSLLRDDLKLELEYLPATHFYLANWVEKSWALYLRERLPDGTYSPWAQRPITGMPLFNDYVSSADEVWVAPGEVPPVDPIAAEARPTESHDPMPGSPIQVTSYLRYAQMDTRRIPGGPRLDPTLSLRLDDGLGSVFDYDLAAFHETEQSGDLGFVDFRWATTEAEREKFMAPALPLLRLSIPGTDIEIVDLIQEVSLQNPDAEFRSIEGSEYSYRVEFVQDLGEQGVLASVELKTPEREFRRWVFDPANRHKEMDVSVAVEQEFDHDDHTGHDHSPSLVPEETFAKDTGIEVLFEPGNEPAPLLLIGGPEQIQLGLVMQLGAPQDGEYLPIDIGERVSLGGGNTLTVTQFSSSSQNVTRPAIIPLRERNKDVREGRAMARFQFSSGGEPYANWARFHQFVFEEPDNPRMAFSPALRRFPFGPTTIVLDDGRVLEFMLSRQRMELPAPVVLDDFELTSHIGGFTGSTVSILNWTSQVRFADGDGEWGDKLPVTVNGPAEHDGLWFFQSAWDPPDQARFRGQVNSAGLNYTVLGVGNRNGVGVQLFGCTVSVIGMIYAFYIKPSIIRKRRKRKPDSEETSQKRRPTGTPVSVGGIAEEVL